MDCAQSLIVGRISIEIRAPDADELQSDLNAFIICGSDKDERIVCFHGVSACHSIRSAIVSQSKPVSRQLS